MELLDLPFEIIDQILDLTLPSGFESFVLSCKAIHARAGDQIQRHAALKQQWRCTIITNHYRGDLFRILYEVSRNLLAGQYVEVLNFRNFEQLASGSNDDFPLSEEIMTQIKKRILETEFFATAGVSATEWWETIADEHKSSGPNEKSDEDATHAITSLLGQLPNLKILQLPSGWYDMWNELTQPSGYDVDSKNSFIAVIDAMINASNDNGHGRPLGKLEVILPTKDVSHDDRAPFQCLEPFMRLKSLRELYGTNCVACDDGYTGYPFQWRFPETNSFLRRVELT